MFRSARSLAVVLTLGLSVLATSACGGPTPEPMVPTTPGPGTDAAPTAWKDDLTQDQKMTFMMEKVAPHMGKVFKGMNAERYAGFGCKTCHGPNMKLPKDFLPTLTMKDGNITAFADKPDVAKFMADKVVPEMASTLGKPPYDPATKSGFGCMGCHTVEMK